MMNLTFKCSAERDQGSGLRSFPCRMRKVKSGEARGPLDQVIEEERGSTLVEMALVTGIFFMLVIGVMNLCLALYSYNYVCHAAREATRYMVVRGSGSCQDSNTTPKMPDCNLLPTNVTSDSNNPVLTYIKGLGFPGINTSQLTLAPTWWVAAAASGSSTFTWTTQCTGAVDAAGLPCNTPKYGVKAVVTYNAPLWIPFWSSATISMSSTSWMVINN